MGSAAAGVEAEAGCVFLPQAVQELPGCGAGFFSGWLGLGQGLLVGAPGLRLARDLGELTLFSRQLVPGLEASASIYNLFDQQFADPASAEFVQESLPQDGRTFRLKLTYRY